MEDTKKSNTNLYAQIRNTPKPLTFLEKIFGKSRKKHCEEQESLISSKDNNTLSKTTTKTSKTKFSL